MFKIIFFLTIFNFGISENAEKLDEKRNLGLVPLEYGMYDGGVDYDGFDVQRFLDYFGPKKLKKKNDYQDYYYYLI